MKSLSALCFFLAAVTCHADCDLPADYEERIKAHLAAQHPQYVEFFCEFYQPKRAIVEPEKKERCAIRCDWGAKLKSGAIPLMIMRSIFVFDGEKVEAVTDETTIAWPDGAPSREKK